ncbi:hypothetical protein [Nostoc sp.]|uniref:hypothetical protein n=1 Tax=Nostoc sp. TaxID=1180 RepID=UPI002FF7EE62
MPFVFSSNGHLFAERGEDTRQIQTSRYLSNFPSPEQLRERWQERLCVVCGRCGRMVRLW